MITHIVLGTNDFARTVAFYRAVLGVLGAGEGMENISKIGKKRHLWLLGETGFGVSEPINGEPASHANGGTIGFRCNSPEQVHAFHDVAVANGGTSIEDPPGERVTDLGSMYLCYFRDPDGNKICGVFKENART